MAHNPIFQRECKVTIDGQSFYGEVIGTPENTSQKRESKYKEQTDSLNYMNDILKKYMNV